MLDLSELQHGLAENWTVWAVSITLVVAAVIDGWKLKVPNWLTFPMILSGWAYGIAFGGWEGLLASVVGTLVGLGLLLPAFAFGGLGAGAVNLLGGVGAWVGAATTLYAFCASALVGALIAVAMVLVKRNWRKHQNQFMAICYEILTIRDPEQLSAIAAQRKSSMLLLPYGIPIAIGSILYFVWTGMLL